LDVELARQQWDEGRRRIEDLRRANPDAYRRMTTQVELVTDELRKRVGQMFTLAELAEHYGGADDWARDVLLDAVQEEEAPPPDTATVADAAFYQYAYLASDYEP
jgi:hypothetical protein